MGSQASLYQLLSPTVVRHSAYSKPYAGGNLFTLVAHNIPVGQSKLVVQPYQRSSISVVQTPVPPQLHWAGGMQAITNPNWGSPRWQQASTPRSQLAIEPQRIFGATQFPAPSHFCSMLLNPFWFRVRVPQDEPVSYVQAAVFEGLQTPPHVPLPAQAERAGVAAWWGAPVKPVHVPTEPVTSQAWHWPVQVELQQTPSVQERLL